MCRSIRTLHNFEPPATRAEVRADALQFGRKLCGFTRPAQANAAAFDRAVDRVADAAQELLGELVNRAPARDREVEAAQAREDHRSSMSPEPRDRAHNDHSCGSGNVGSSGRKRLSQV